VIVEKAVWPAETFTFVGLAVKVKSSTIRLAVTECVRPRVVSLAVTVSVYVVITVLRLALTLKEPVPDVWVDERKTW
jgi:hypothetical protein